MKVAICFSGQVRTFEKCFPSYSRILDRYDCDLFAASTPNEVLPNYPFKRLVMTEDVSLDEKNYGNRKRPEITMQNVLRQFRFIEICDDLRVQEGVEYDFVIRTRFDNLLLRDIPDLHDCDREAIHIPREHDWGGINDRFAFGGDRAMRVYCDKNSRIDDFMIQGGVFHPETILLWVLRSRGLSITRIWECTRLLREDGQLV